jgi:hypothetical protein
MLSFSAEVFIAKSRFCYSNTLFLQPARRVFFLVLFEGIQGKP